MAFTMKRVYEPAEASDGYRVLVDRLWPRGVKKERAELDASPAAQELLETGREHDRVTLVFAARDEQVNHVSVLLEWLAAHGASVES